MKKYNKFANGRLFKNPEDPNSNRPQYGNGSVEVTQDVTLRAGDKIQYAGWLNTSDDGEKHLSVSISQVVEDGAAPKQSGAATPSNVEALPGAPF